MQTSVFLAKLIGPILVLAAVGGAAWYLLRPEPARPPVVTVAAPHATATAAPVLAPPSSSTAPSFVCAITVRRRCKRSWKQGPSGYVRS